MLTLGAESEQFRLQGTSGGPLVQCPCSSRAN